MLPEDNAVFEKLLAQNMSLDPRPTYILKPSGGSQGRGIKLVQTRAHLVQALAQAHTENFVAQEYIENPLLINGYFGSFLL